ncbi:helix-turn-helix transcriptional regulator [Nocardia sp. NPDC052112]|uniref:helix-turn-helix transcriptional regulator n=1 Tax=Nocardia sp. NPDC052112 TaxID=3155646 RepID=UPI00342DE30F
MTNNPITEPARQPATVADELAREIKRVRLEVGISQRALAAKIGYSRQYVSMAEWENSDLPSAELIRAIDTALCAGGELVALRAKAGSRQRAEISTTYPSQAEATKEIRDLTVDAGAIDVMAIRGLGILGLNDSLLRDSLPAHARLRVLLMDPESEAVATRAQAIGESADSFAVGIRLSIARIKELADAGRPVEIYTYSQVPVWRIIKIDDVLFVSAFTMNREGHTSPTHRFDPNDQGVLHHAFVSTFEQAVSSATRIV